jgi:hypothetical protein
VFQPSLFPEVSELPNLLAPMSVFTTPITIVCGFPFPFSITVSILVQNIYQENNALHILINGQDIDIQLPILFAHGHFLQQDIKILN